MDTRRKIMAGSGFSEVIAEGNWIVVAGLFDPWTADNASNLVGIIGREPQCRLAVVVLELHDAHLSFEVRATVVAALRCVDFVVCGNLDSLPEESPRVRVVHHPEADRRHSDRFVQLVLSRQKAGSE